MDAPKGAKQPADRQSSFVKPEEHSEGWDLLRPPLDLEFWEVTEFMAIVAKVKMRGETFDLNASGLRVIGDIAKQLQTVVANNSAEFRAWFKQGDFSDQASRILPLAMEYAGALGEATSSES